MTARPRPAPLDALTLVLAVVLASCQAERAVIDLPLRVSTTDAWSGDTVLVTSPGFAGQAPTVLVGTDTLAVSMVDDSTAAVILPDTNGSIQLHVERGQSASVSVQVHGFDDLALYRPFQGPPAIWPGANPGIIGISHDSVLHLDLRTGATTLVLPVGVTHQECGWPHNALDDPGIITVGGWNGTSCSSFNSWRIGASAPMDTIAFATACGIVARLSAGVAVQATFNSAFAVLTRPGGTWQQSPLSLKVVYTENLLMSNGLVIPSGGRGDDSIPIIAQASGAPSYMAGRSWDWYYQATFADHATHVLAAMRNGTTASKFLRLDASTRAAIDSLPLGGRAYAVAVDDSSHTAFVLETFGVNAVNLRVIDLQQFRTTAVVRGPATLQQLIGTPQGSRVELMFAPLEHRLYAVATTSGGGCPFAGTMSGPTVVATFSLIP